MSVTTLPPAQPCRATGAALLCAPTALADGALPPVPLLGATADIRSVAIPSALTGAVAGVAGGWQTAVESAQVLAGVVDYSTANPFYMYHVKVWTLLHQLPAILLACGVSEGAVCVLLGGLVGTVSFLALSLAALAISGRRALAVAMPLLVLAAGVYLETRGVYPLRILSDKPWIIYGAMGTSYVALAWSLVALGRLRMGGFLLGLAPAVHPTLGAWCLAVGLAAALWPRPARGSLQRLLAWSALGAGLSAVSLGAQLHLARHIPDVPPEVQAQYLAAYAAAWDTHRQPYPLTDPSVLFAALTLLLCVARLRLHTDLTSPCRTMLRMLVVSTALSLVLCLATHVPQVLPSVVQMAMPGRFINVTTLLFPSLAIGLSSTTPSRCLAACATCAIVAVCGLKLAHEHGMLYLPGTWPIFSAAAILVLALSWPPALAESQNAASRTASRGAILRRFACAAGTVVLLCYSRGTIATLLVGLAVVGCLLPSVMEVIARRRLVAAISIVAAVASAAAASLAVLGTAATAGLALVAAAVLSSDGKGRFAAWRRVRPALTAVGVCMLCVVAISRGGSTARELRDWRNDPFYAALHEGRGYVATVAGVGNLQLRGRRPVLLEVSGLNQLPYVPQSGPTMNLVLREVYGEDLLAGPPRDGRRRPGLDPQAARALWESRDPATWRRLARRHGFTSIVAYSSWRLQLPVVAQSGKLTLFEVPTADDDPSATLTAQPVSKKAH
jgi:hypothetical protein